MGVRVPRRAFVGALGVIVLLLPGSAAFPHTIPGLPLSERQRTPGASLPELPQLDIESYPDDARNQIAAAYTAAQGARDDAEAVGHLGLVLHAWDQHQAAAASYERARSLAPQAVDWWYLGALLASRQGLHVEAAGLYRGAHALRPNDPLIALRRAEAALEAGLVEEARQLFTSLATGDQTAPAALYGLGRIHQMEGQPDPARDAFARAVALYPPFGAAHYALAQLQRRAGDRLAALGSLQRQQECLRCWPMPPDPWRARLEAVRQDAGALLSRGIGAAGPGTDSAVAEAIRLHEAALAHTADLGLAHVNLIGLYGNTGNLTRAAEHYAAARALPGYEAEAHRTWGWQLLRVGRTEEALTALTEATALAPGDAQAQNGRGMALEVLGRLADATQAYGAAVSANPADKQVRFNLARALLGLGRLDEAITHLDRLRQPEDASTPRHVFALSVAHVRRGDLSTGLRLAETALELARRFDQTDLVQSIERDLAQLRAEIAR